MLNRLLELLREGGTRRIRSLADDLDTTPELVEAIRKGRRNEFAAFQWQGELPDPQDKATFLSARINHNLRHEGQHHVLLKFYKELIRLRKEIPALANLVKDTLEIKGNEKNNQLYINAIFP